MWQGGGHTWPKGFQYQHEALVGRTSQHIDVSLVISYLFARIGLARVIPFL